MISIFKEIKTGKYFMELSNGSLKGFYEPYTDTPSRESLTKVDSFDFPELNLKSSIKYYGLNNIIMVFNTPPIDDVTMSVAEYLNFMCASIITGVTTENPLTGKFSSLVVDLSNLRCIIDTISRKSFPIPDPLKYSLFRMYVMHDFSKSPDDDISSVSIMSSFYIKETKKIRIAEYGNVHEYSKDGTEWVYITSEIMRKIERYLNKHVDFLDKAEVYLNTIEQMRLSLLDGINNTVTYLCTSLGYCNNIDIAENDINAVLCNLMTNFKTPVHPDDVFGYHIGNYNWHKQYSAPYYDLYLDTNKEFSVAGINEAIKAGDLSVLDDHDTLSYDSIIDLLRSPLYLRKYRNKYVEEEENADIYNRSEDNEDK